LDIRLFNSELISCHTRFEATTTSKNKYDTLNFVKKYYKQHC